MNRKEVEEYASILLGLPEDIRVEITPSDINQFLGVTLTESQVTRVYYRFRYVEGLNEEKS